MHQRIRSNNLFVMLPLMMLFSFPVFAQQIANPQIKTAAVDATTTVNPTTSVDSPTTAHQDVATTSFITHDPLEHFNRSAFALNMKLDKYILKPLATLYNSIMPKPLNAGIRNFFNNLDTLPTIANDVLQFNFYQMANDAWRFTINSTIGVAGLFDVATQMDLPYYYTDFGITMAKWGWTNSTYLVLPVFGPNTFRDGIEIPVDYYAFSIYPRIHPRGTRYVLYGVGVINRRAQLLQYQSVFEEAAVDKYIFTRNAYLQRRAFQVEQAHHRGFMQANINTNATQ